MSIDGHVASGWERVADAFRENFATRAEVGASVCIFEHGIPVVDLWGGKADATTPWTRDTVSLVFSATKGLAAICLLMLADRGQLDLDAPVTSVWPELKVLGTTTIRTLLNHRAGTSVIDTPITLAQVSDPEVLARILEAQPPTWPSGSLQGYGATAWGMYAAALFQKVAGESLGTFFQREVAGRLGVDAWIGLPPSIDPRVATLYPPTPFERLRYQIPSMLTSGLDGRMVRNIVFRRGSFTYRALANPIDLGPKGFDIFNKPQVWRAELPWCNGITNARAIATIYSALIEGKLTSKAAIEPLRTPQSWGDDQVMCKPMGFSQGFMKEESHLYWPTAGSFGHSGTGGTLGWCDPDRGISLAYTMNRIDWRIRSERTLALCHAAAACAGVS